MPSMKVKDSKRLKQTTLFDSPISKRHHSSPSLSHSSGDGGIRLGPKPPENEMKIIRRKRGVTVGSSDEEDVPSSSKQTYKRRLIRFESSFEGSNPPAQEASTSQIVDLVPRKRRRLRRRRSLGSSVADADEDIDQLVDEVDEEDILESRLRTRNKKSYYQQNLEKLKRRKLKVNTSSDNEGTADEWAVHEGICTPFKGAKPSSEVNNLAAEETTSESSDFIVDDDNDFQLPAQFSMETHQDLSHQFKKIFQFLVHIAVRPPKRRSSFMKKKLIDEEYFSAPLTIMRRKLLGIRDSLVASSVWRPAFKEGLERHPDFSLTRLDFAVPTCDACHLGGRMSTLIGRLTGSRYNASGFDPLLSDEGSDEGVEYHLGRFCARRAKVYHEFSHWEFELFQCISRELEELRGSLGDSGFHRIAYFHGAEPPNDLSDADALCEWLDQRQIIDREWQKLETLMESAHRLDMPRKNGEDN